MTITLYDATVERFLQGLAGVSSVLERGLAHCTEAGVDPAEIVETRLAPDMLPFRFQIVSVAAHSLGAIESVKVGLYTPPDRSSTADYAGLQAMVTHAREGLEKLARDEVDGLGGRDVLLKAGEHRIEFDSEGFLLSFSLPNFYFHAATAYDILRSKGAPLGKGNFLGRLRTKG